MQGNTTEIDERNLLQLDALLSHGYGLSPQLVMRSKGLSIEAKALYGYLSSFAGAGDTAFPSTSRILEELDISKNRFYKIRKELISWGFISIETTATSAGLRTVYTLPQNPIAIKTEIDEIASRRNEIKSSLVANLHNEDTVSHKGDSESEHLQQSAGNEPCRQSEAKAQNRGSNLKPCLQSEDEGCLQSGDKLYIDTNINPKVSIDRSAAHPSDDEGPSDWKLALYTGMRVGELSGLMWEDIDETRQCIIIQHSEKYNALKKTFFVSTPKSGKTRVFPLTAEIAALLKNVREVESKYGYLTEFVFSGPNGRIHKTNISSYMIARTSGDGFTNQKSIHTARRTLNSELIASGAPRAMCCALIGNTELVNETFYTYDVSTKNYKLEMVSKINQRTINNNDNIDVEKLSSNQE